MIPEQIAHLTAEREKEAQALLESHPRYAGANVVVHEWVIDNKISEQLAMTAPGSGARMEVVLNTLKVRAKVYSDLVDDMPLQKAFMVALGRMAQVAWEEFTGYPIAALNPESLEACRRWSEIMTTIRHWENEGFKRLAVKVAAQVPGQAARDTSQRRGYREEIKAWMEALGITSQKQAARRLAVSIDVLKSIMSDKGRRRYSAETLAQVLEKIEKTKR